MGTSESMNEIFLQKHMAVVSKTTSSPVQYMEYFALLKFASVAEFNCFSRVVFRFHPLKLLDGVIDSKREFLKIARSFS